MYSFDGTDGFSPWAAPLQATDGNLYGTTAAGGASYPTNSNGTIFQLTTAGDFSTLFNFCPQGVCPDGTGPYLGLLQATDGNFYGTTISGGANGYGTFFRLSSGLHAFVKTMSNSGKVGTAVIILGTNLVGANSVDFNGTLAVRFQVNSTGSAITTTVPAGATTGTVHVATPTGTLSSNTAFIVRP